MAGSCSAVLTSSIGIRFEIRDAILKYLMFLRFKQSSCPVSTVPVKMGQNRQKNITIKILMSYSNCDAESLSALGIFQLDRMTVRNCHKTN